ncbi:ComF family protein [Streptomyces sp. NBC_00075]|uniref:ComF family protein n=1 Tax=Streptomyces sp. NBC_00075 TaxID=2975641 RepID=UPI00324F7054
MRGWWQDLSDLVLPAECGGCGRPRTVLCPECRAALDGAAPSRVRPVPEPPGLPVVHAAARYEDEVRAVLLAHKERGALTLAGPLGTALAGAVRAGLPTGALRGGTGVLLVPVPSARRAVRARGHDPARRIALAAAGVLRGSGTSARVLAVLRQRRAVADQAGLNSRERLDNLAGALGVVAGGGRLLVGGSGSGSGSEGGGGGEGGGGPGSGSGGGAVVLVDDLMTTGASLAEAARAVREAVADVRGARNAVYSGAGWEGRGERWPGAAGTGVERRPGVSGMVAPAAFEVMICAAVVAATPDSFEINRN